MTKFDGGNDLAQHFPLIATATKALPAREAIIDAELVACSNSGLPNFYRLLSGKAEPYELCLWAFDLLHLCRNDLREEDGVAIVPSVSSIWGRVET